jgi:glycosyltransferase involved in cell wall biosynthesis
MPARVLFAIGGLARGGSERQLMQLISAAHPDSLKATVLTFSKDCDPSHRELLRERGVELIQLSPEALPRPLRPALSVPKTIQVLRRVRPQVVYAWLEEAATTMTPACRALGIPLVVARRSVCGSPAESQAIFRHSIRWAEKRAQLVTGNSEAVLREAEARGIRPERLRLTRNGHPPVEALPLPGGSEVSLGYLANYRPEKGHFRLIEALELVRAETPWQVRIAGAGPLREDVAQRIGERGLADRVEAAGPVQDVTAFWAEQDVAVLLSDDEGSPNALIEAAMLGRPLVGSDGGGTREIVSPGGGLLVSRAPTEIAAALERLIEDPDLRQRLGEGARRHALEQHDLAASVAAHLAVIDEALAVPASGN